MADKPGSVPLQAEAMAIHLGRSLPNASCDLPERRAQQTGLSGKPDARSYMVLLPVGFTLPPPLPKTRCALTAPFHPCPLKSGRFAFCGTFPGVAPAGGYPAPCLCGARTFLPGSGKPKPKRPPSHLTRSLGSPAFGSRQRPPAGKLGRISANTTEQHRTS